MVADDDCPDLALTESVDDESQALENTIQRFTASLLPLHQLNGTLAESKHSLIVVHTLAQAALVRLHYRFSENNHLRHEKCLQAARACLLIIRHIGDADYDYLDPIIGVSTTYIYSFLVLNYRTYVCSSVMLGVGG